MTRTERRAAKNNLRNQIRAFLKIQEDCFPDCFLPFDLHNSNNNDKIIEAIFIFQSIPLRKRCFYNSWQQVILWGNESSQPLRGLFLCKKTNHKRRK